MTVSYAPTNNYNSHTSNWSSNSNNCSLFKLDIIITINKYKLEFLKVYRTNISLVIIFI